jgi:uncharacterized membrane protein HdeD (DUF308 family)
MAIPVDAAAAALREAMRDTVKRYSLWYLVQGILMVVTGVLALISPWIASVAIIRLLGWFLIVSGVLQGIGVIGARHAPNFWLELISAVLAILIGLLLLRHTDAGLLFFSVLLIVFFMVEGIVKVVFALSIRPFPNWGWVLGSGVVGYGGPALGRMEPRQPDDEEPTSACARCLRGKTEAGTSKWQEPERIHPSPAEPGVFPLFSLYNSATLA